MIPHEYVVMYIGANAVALTILAIAFWLPRVALWTWVAIFAWAAVVNIRTVASEPYVYLVYGALTPSELYRDFINGWFSTHIQLLVLSIAVGQLSIAVLLSHEDVGRGLGVFGAIVFLLAIAPLGVGSGFPFSLIAVASLLVMARRLRSSSVAHPSTAGRFIPTPDVSDRHEVIVRAPADLVFEVAANLDLRSLAIVNALFWLRGKLLGDAPVARQARGLVAETRALGWGVLSYAQRRTLVMGAVTQPWKRDVTFRGLAPERFVAFNEPGFAKIVWTLEAEPRDEAVTCFRTETRVALTDAAARRRFVWYWRAFGAGILLIRRLMLRAVRREAERQYRTRLRHSAPVAA